MTPIKIFLLVSNVIIIPCYGILTVILMAVLIPYNIFSNDELEEIENNYSSRPLLKIRNYSYYHGDSQPLFGSYKGFKGGHKYKNCDYLFSGTCADYKNKEVYCPSKSSQKKKTKKKKVDKEHCVDYTEIKSFPYIELRDNFYYYTKMSKTYEKLLNETVNKNEECPFSKKNCGFLNKEKKLCLSTDEICPINDIIINNQSTYSENGITYNSIVFGSDYIHYTNEKTNNDIILDLLISIENPLSKIEVGEKLYKKNKLKLHELEADTYYKGSIDNYIVYKKLFNTEMTLEELFKLYGKLDTIKSEPDYKTEYLKSKIFIYKKYPVPLNGLTIEEIEDTRKKYNNVSGYNFGTCFMLIATLYISIFFLIDNSYKARIISYILLTMIDIGVIILFYFSSKVIFHPDILVNYPEKNHHRIQFLVLFIFHVIVSIYQNLSTIYILIQINREGNPEENEVKMIDKEKVDELPLYPM